MKIFGLKKLPLKSTKILFLITRELTICRLLSTIEDLTPKFKCFDQIINLMFNENIWF